jgi:lysozyme family protein
MSAFEQSYDGMISNEGGYVLHDVPGDRGGQTYAGISRKNWPQWAGWHDIDVGREPEADTVRAFYRANFWLPMNADKITDARIAGTLFDFAVNAGVKVAAILAQTVVGTTPDGKIGPKTLAALNTVNADLFLARFALAKIARYAAIVTRDRSQGRFLLGWVNRTLKDSV